MNGIGEGGEEQLKEMKWGGKSWEVQVWKAEKKMGEKEMKRDMDRGNKQWER